MPLAIIVILIQVACAVHAIKTGRDRWWIWIIIMVPLLGCILYFVTQMGPDAAGSRSAQKARKRLISTVDPQRELRARMDALEISDTVENRIALAHECMEANLYDEAIVALEKSMTGLHENDPQLMSMLAQCRFEKGEPGLAAKILEELIQANPDYQSVDGHLLYARALEGMGDTEGACREYDVLRSSYPGEEARVRYALLLQSMNETGRAAELLQETLVRARRAPAHYRKKEREWIKIAERRI